MRNFFLALATGLFSIAIFPATSTLLDPLPSWTDQATKKDFIQFIHYVTDTKSNLYVEPSQRIATIDNDGTLWVEQPLYTQAIFAIEQIKQLAPTHPEWKNQEPFKTILSDQPAELTKLSVSDFERIIAVTHSGMSVETFQKSVQNWLQTAKNKKFDRPYTELIYQPMLEVIRYLNANNFKVYIVSGGGQEFIRAFSEKTYQIPTEQVIGSAGKTNYIMLKGQPVLMKLPQLLFIDDHTGKPEAINLFIGKKPVVAFGNSDGDREMLEWTQSRPGAHFMALVHHDDAEREFSYGSNSKMGTFSNSLMVEAKKQGWHVISMKHDWKTIFPAK